MKTIYAGVPKSEAYTMTASAKETALLIKNLVGSTRRHTLTIQPIGHAITGLEISFAAIPDGTHVVRAAGSDFDTATDRWSATSGLSTLADGTAGQIDLDLTGIAEVKVNVTNTVGTVINFELN